MRVKMLEDRAVVVDGITRVDAEAGESYEMGDGVAESLIDQGAAEAVDENKDAGDAPEVQAKKPARGRGKTKPNPEAAAEDADAAAAGAPEDDPAEP